VQATAARASLLPSTFRQVLVNRQEEAVRTLCHGINNDKPLETLGWVFRDLQSAWRYIADWIG
jgi:hypothetical protein